ncbi:hypothetical protein YTPLAS18_26640 [Nitrospira sp.]|nr:hypothetical protein YTPLAS18_26640 [Nitrospira sp.]
MRLVPHDRIVEVGLHGKEGAYILIAELTGRSANLWLVDTARKILARLRPAATNVQDGLLRPESQRGPSPSVTRHRFVTTTDDDGSDEFPISRAMEAHYTDREQQILQESTQRERTLVLKRAVKKLTRRIEALESDLAKAERYRGYARYGDLIKANLAQVRKGQTEASLIDYFDEALPTLSLPLDPVKSPQSNMEEYFRKYRKYLTAQSEIAPRIATAQAELIRIRQELDSIERSTWTPPHDRPVRRANVDARSAPPSGSRHTQRKGPFRRFQSTDGYHIYVGCNARENEELTHRFANSDDVWLHARGVPGSHVIVRVPKGSEIPPETLRDAATLALIYSDLKKSGKGEVIYTRKKWVRKTKGHSAGTVSVTQEKSLFVQLDRARMDRLKGLREERP